MNDTMNIYNVKVWRRMLEDVCIEECDEEELAFYKDYIIRSLDKISDNEILEQPFIKKYVDYAKDMYIQIDRRLMEEDDEALTPDYIIEVVSDYTGISYEDIVSNKRDKEIVTARHMVMYLCRKYLCDYSLKEIGDAVGGKDHAYVIGGIEMMKARIKTDMDVKRTIEEIERQLGDANNYEEKIESHRTKTHKPSGEKEKVVKRISIEDVIMGASFTTAIVAGAAALILNDK